MKTFRIDVTGTFISSLKVKAETMDEAIEKVKQNRGFQCQAIEPLWVKYSESPTADWDATEIDNE